MSQAEQEVEGRSHTTYNQATASAGDGLEYLLHQINPQTSCLHRQRAVLEPGFNPPHPLGFQGLGLGFRVLGFKVQGLRV